MLKQNLSLFALFLLNSALFAASVTETPQGLVMENKFIKVRLVPKLGGKVDAFIKKDTGTEFCGKYGAMIDRLMISGKKGDDFESKPFKYEITKKEPQEVIVNFSSRGKSPGYRDIYFSKTITLSEKSNMLKTRACFENKGTETIPISYWVTNNFQDSKNSARYFAPAADGIYEAWCEGNKGKGRGVSGQDRYIYNPPRAWTGMVNTDGNGIVAVTENKYLSCFYNFFGTNSTIEWIYNSIPLEPGKKWAVEYSFMPFDGFKTISGASALGALCISTPSNSSGAVTDTVSFNVSASEDFDAAVKVKAFLNEKETSILFEKSSVHFTGGKTCSFPFDIKSVKAETFGITAELSAAGNEKPAEAFAQMLGGSFSDKFVIVPDIKEREGKVTDTANKTQIASLDIPEFYVADDNTFVDGSRWAKPYIKGHLNVLFLLEWEQREIIELAKRLSLNYVVVRNPEALQKELTRGFDVLVIGGFAWDKFSTETQKAIIDSVSGGRGLVFITGKNMDNSKLIKAIGKRSDTSEVTDKIPLKMLDVLQEKNEIIGGETGKGRVLFMNYKNHVRVTLASLLPVCRINPGYGSVSFSETSREYEYSLCLLIKSILWASGKLPTEKIIFKKTQSREDKIAKLSVSYINPSNNICTRYAELGIRDAGNNIVHKDKHNLYLEPGTNIDSFPIPNLTEGNYGADIVLYDNWGRAIDFGINVFDVISTARITEIETDKPSYKSGENISCKMKVSSKDKKEVKIRISLEDINGWVLAADEKKVALNPEENMLSFNLPTFRTLKRTHFIVSQIFDNDKLLSGSRKEVIIAPPFGDDFLLTSYSSPVKPSVDLGLNSVYDRFETASSFDLPYIPWYAPWTMPLGLGRGMKELGKNFIDWANVEERNKIAEGIKKRGVEIEAKYRPPAGILIDEFRPDAEALASASRNFEEHKKQFRVFLKNIYKKIENLNSQWETSYKNFDEITPWESEKLSARVQDFWKTGKLNFSPSFDHKAYWEYLFADYIDFINKTMRTVYPDAKLGPSGCNGAIENICFDYWQLAGENKCPVFGMYSGYLRNVAGSLKNKNGKVYYWSGYDRTVSGEKKLRMDLWQNLFENGDGVSYYAAKTYSPLFSPDWRPYPSGEWIKEESNIIINNGVGYLVRNAERVYDNIAILYSPRSLHAAKLGDITGETSGEKLYSAEHTSMLAILKDIGFQPSYISYVQIENGALKPEKYRILLLPYSQALSDKEAEEISKYVKNGGTVIATIKPGVFDEHGKTRNSPCLDEVFGVKQKNIPSYETVSISSADKKIFGDSAFDVIQGDPKLEITKGTALVTFVKEKTPKGCIVNNYGKGKGIFLNFSISDYRKSSGGGVGGEIEIVKKAKKEIAENSRSFYRSLLAYVNVKPQITVTSADNEVSLPLDIIRFRDNDTVLVGILTGMDRKLILSSDIYPAKVRLPQEYFVYNVIEGKFLGKHKIIEDIITDGKPKLYALLKEPVKDISVSLIPAGTANNLSDIKIDIKDKVSSSAKITVKTPSAKTYFEKTVAVKNGSAKIGFAFPLNAEDGIWIIEVQDVISKKKDFMAVKIKNDEVK